MRWPWSKQGPCGLSSDVSIVRTVCGPHRGSICDTAQCGSSWEHSPRPRGFARKPGMEAREGPAEPPAFAPKKGGRCLRARPAWAAPSASADPGPPDPAARAPDPGRRPRQGSGRRAAPRLLPAYS